MLKILIVDDDGSNRDSLGKLLSCYGFVTEAAADSREAFEAAGSFEPDVVIADWMLQNEVDGIEVAKVLRERDPSLRIVVISGYPKPSLEDRVHAIPGATFLAKPFAAAALIEAIRGEAAPDAV